MIRGPGAYPCFRVSAYLSVVCCIVCLHALYTHACAPTRAPLVQTRCNIWEVRTARPRGVEKGAPARAPARACVANIACSLAPTLACGQVCHCLIRDTFIQSIPVAAYVSLCFYCHSYHGLLIQTKYIIRCRGTNPHANHITHSFVV